MVWRFRSCPRVLSFIWFSLLIPCLVLLPLSLSSLIGALIHFTD